MCLSARSRHGVLKVRLPDVNASPSRALRVGAIRESDLAYARHRPRRSIYPVVAPGFVSSLAMLM